MFEVAPSPNDIKNQLKSVHIQIDTSTDGSIFFTAQNCSTYITHYVIDYAPKNHEICQREMVPCNHAGRYHHKLCQSHENVMFSIIPVLESNRATTRNSKPIERRYWTAAGQADFENIRPEVHGLAMGIFSSQGSIKFRKLLIPYFSYSNLQNLVLVEFYRHQRSAMSRPPLTKKLCSG